MNAFSTVFLSDPIQGITLAREIIDASKHVPIVLMMVHPACS
jgi:hypothetical protein